MITQILIRPDGTTTVKQGEPTLEEMQKAVEGWIERVPYFHSHNSHPCHVYCNEEGKLRFLPVNRMATELWREASPFIRDVLCGNVLILTGTVKELEEM